MYKEIPEFIIIRNLKTAGITRKEYLRLLKGWLVRNSFY